MKISALCGRHILVALLVFALASSLQGQAPASAPTGKPVEAPGASSDGGVSVFVSVRDKHGKPIENLSRNDFRLEEDGRPQAIRYLGYASDLTVTLGLLVDINSSQREYLQQERSAIGNFINQALRENRDKGFLIHFDREVELLQDLTPSRQKLTSALDSLGAPQMRRPRAGQDADSSSQQTTERLPDPGDGNAPGRTGGGRSGGGYPGGRSGGGSGRQPQRMTSGPLLYDAIFLGSSEMMQKQAGHKAIILLSDGVDRGSKVTLARAIESAQRADTAVYGILLVGKQQDWDNRSNRDVWDRGSGGPMGHPGRYPRSPQPSPQPQRQERPDGKKTMERLSGETGGRMFEVTKKQNLDEICRQIQQELKNRYRIAYISDRPGDGGYRKLRVTTQQKGAVMQARDGYYPAQAKRESVESGKSGARE